MAKIVVVGTGEWADLSHTYLTHDSPHQVMAFTADRDYVGRKEHLGLPVVAFEDVENLYRPDHFSHNHDKRSPGKRDGLVIKL